MGFEMRTKYNFIAICLDLHCLYIGDASLFVKEECGLDNFHIAKIWINQVLWSVLLLWDRSRRRGAMVCFGFCLSHLVLLAKQSGSAWVWILQMENMHSKKESSPCHKNI